MGGRRHLALLDHGFASRLANFPHVKVFRANLLAQTANAARVDEFVAVTLAHDDGEIVVDLPDVFLGVAFEAGQEFTDFNALHALALETSCASCIASCAEEYPALGSDMATSGKRFNPFRAGEKPGFVGPFIFSGSCERNLLQESVDGNRGPTTIGNRSLWANDLRAPTQNFRRQIRPARLVSKVSGFTDTTPSKSRVPVRFDLGSAISRLPHKQRHNPSRRSDRRFSDPTTVLEANFDGRASSIPQSHPGSRSRQLRLGIIPQTAHQVCRWLRIWLP